MAFDSNQLFNTGVTAITADGQSSGLTVGPGEHDIEIDVQARSGTSPTMDIKVQEYNGSSWVDLAVFPQMTAVGQWHRKVRTNYDQLRLSNQISFTLFTLAGRLNSSVSPSPVRDTSSPVTHVSSNAVWIAP